MADDRTDDEIAEDVMNDDKDPLDAIRDIRRDEGVAEEDLPESESEVMEDIIDEEPAKDEADELIDDMQKDDKGEDDKSADQVAADDAATAADAAIVAADKAADKAAGKEVEADETPDDKPGESDETPAGEVYKFKANGKDFEFTQTEMLEQFETIFGQSMNYTQKMQKIAPYRKMISALEQEGVTHDSLNLALDALKGDKGALKKLVEKAKIDPYDLSPDADEDTPYVPGVYGKDEIALDIEEITSKISGDEEFKITKDVIDVQWDEKSRITIADNPNYITGLHNDIVSGLYDKVAAAAMKMKVLDGNTKSDIEYYMLAGSQHVQQTETDAKLQEGTDKVAELNADAQGADSKFDKASSEAERKRAASSTGKRADRKGVINYLDDNDEDFDAWYKKLNASI
jgi:hypothetical protein